MSMLATWFQASPLHVLKVRHPFPALLYEEYTQSYHQAQHYTKYSLSTYVRLACIQNLNYIPLSPMYVFTLAQSTYVLATFVLVIFKCLNTTLQFTTAGSSVTTVTNIFSYIRTYTYHSTSLYYMKTKYVTLYVCTYVRMYVCVEEAAQNKESFQKLTLHGCALGVHQICLCNPRRHPGSLHKPLKRS